MRHEHPAEVPRSTEVMDVADVLWRFIVCDRLGFSSGLAKSFCGHKGYTERGLK